MSKLFPDEELDAYCTYCGRRYEWVIPGKTQPVCNCHQMCSCGGKITYHEYDINAAPGGMYGWYCDECCDIEV